MRGKLKKPLILVVLTAVLIGFSGCQKSDDFAEQDQLGLIQQKIDHKRYDEAEAELQQILQKEPDNKRARTILASVYVHRAGISVREYFMLEALLHDDESSVKPLINIDVLEKLEIKKDSQFQKALNFLKQVNAVAVQSQKMAEKFEKIPLLNEKSAVDVYRALMELERLNEPTRGMSFYRGVIKLIYFKYLWETEKFIKIGDNKLCSTSMSKLNNQLETLKNYSVGMINDIASGVPKSEEQFKKMSLELNKSVSRAQSFVNALGNSQSKVSEVINQVVQTADIKGFKCSF